MKKIKKSLRARTSWNWVKWNLRGRPTVVIVSSCYGGKPPNNLIEETDFVPDYLVDEYWRMRDPSDPHHYQMG